MIVSRPKAKALKRIDFSRSCFYQLPDDSTQATLIDYELMFRSRYSGIFRIRTGTMFIFELPDVMGRDFFLNVMEKEAKNDGLIVVRDIYYPD